MAEITDAHVAAIRHQAAKKAWLKRQRAGQEPKAASAPKGGKQGDYANPHAAREEGLRNSPVREKKYLGGGITETEKVTLENGEVGVWKPQSGDPNFVVRGGLQTGKGKEREAAAWEVAKLGGMDDMMQPVVIREIGGQKGSLSAWSDGQPAKMVTGGKRYGSEEATARVAVFDFVIGNQDRHAGNWIVTPSGGIKMIDHGLSFGEARGSGGNFAFQRTVADRLAPRMDRWSPTQQKYVPHDNTALPKMLAAHAAPYIKNKAAIRERLLASGLDSRSVTRTMTRIAKMEKAQSASDWMDLMKSKG